MERAKFKGPSGWRGLALTAAAVIALLAPAGLDAQEKTGSETPAPKPVQGKLVVYTQPEGAAVLVDGEKIEAGAPARVSVAPGPHEVRVEMDGYQSETRTVAVAAGQSSSLMLILTPLPDHALADRKQANSGAYFLAGPALLYIASSNITLSSSTTAAEKKLKGADRSAPGLGLQLRYIQPFHETGFLIVDTNYLDARFSMSNVRFPKPQGKVDKIELLLFRGGVEFSLAPNAIDFFTPYLGAGLHYTVIRDAKGGTWLGADHQEEFIGYTLKTGCFWNSRYHLVIGAEYQYHWAYQMEDSMFLGSLGWQF